VLIVVFYFIFPSYNLIPFPYNFGGLVIAFCGLMLMGKCRDLFKKHGTTLKFEKSSSLVTVGVFGWSRNPMYLGMFLLLLGIAICFRNLCSVAVAFGFITLIEILFIPQEAPADRWKLPGLCPNVYGHPCFTQTWTEVLLRTQSAVY
jgi:protein-S-isoprenylcysteine O-methyltransferase Ste14